MISAHRGGSVVPGESAAERYRRAIELGVDHMEFEGGEALTFKELLELADGRVGLPLDLKETLVVNKALQACPVERLAVTGDDAVIRKVKDEFPRLQVGLSLGEDLDGATPWVMLSVLPR